MLEGSTRGCRTRVRQIILVSQTSRQILFAKLFSCFPNLSGVTTVLEKPFLISFNVRRIVSSPGQFHWETCIRDSGLKDCGNQRKAFSWKFVANRTNCFVKRSSFSKKNCLSFSMFRVHQRPFCFTILGCYTSSIL